MSASSKLINLLIYMHYTHGDVYTLVPNTSFLDVRTKSTQKSWVDEISAIGIIQYSKIFGRIRCIE